MSLAEASGEYLRKMENDEKVIVHVGPPSAIRQCWQAPAPKARVVGQGRVKGESRVSQDDAVEDVLVAGEGVRLVVAAGGAKTDSGATRCELQGSVSVITGPAYAMVRCAVRCVRVWGG